MRVKRLRNYLLGCLAAAFLLPAAAADAADSVYWTSNGGSAISTAPLAGGGSTQTLYDFPSLNAPRGVAIDPAAGRIYWTAVDDEAIRGAPLDGSGPVDTLYIGAGQGVEFPQALVIDAAAGYVYWVNFFPDWTIRRAPLSGAGPVETLYDGVADKVQEPIGIAIDPAAGRLYWINHSDANNGILGAPLDGSGPVDTLYAFNPNGDVGLPLGVAIDPAAQRIYWSNSFDDTIRGAPIAGGGPIDILYTGPQAGASFSHGIAIDAAAGFLYWGANSAFTPPLTAIFRMPLGGGPPDTLYIPTGEAAIPESVAVLRAPVGSGEPLVSRVPKDGKGKKKAAGGRKRNKKFSCTEGSWAPDVTGAFLFRAPRSFAYQWRRKGKDIRGATEPTYTPKKKGSYTCRVTATNQAGSGSQTSAVKKRCKKGRRFVERDGGERCVKKVKRADKR